MDSNNTNNTPPVVPSRVADGAFGNAMGLWILGEVLQLLSQAGINGSTINAGNVTGTLPALVAKISVYLNSVFVAANAALNFSSNFTVTDNTSNIGIDLASTGVTSGTYGDPTHYMTGTVDAKGRLTSASQLALPAAGGSVEVKEVDGAPDVATASLLIFPNSTLTDNGGGSVSFAYNFGTGAGTVCQGNDSRLSDARTPSFSNQSANTVLAGPTTGSPAAPGFRALVAADVPAHQSTHQSGGSDALIGSLDANARVSVALAGVETAKRRQINFMASTGITVTETDDPSNERVNLQITATGGVAPAAHEATHEAGGTDALPWTTIHGYGTLASRPAASASNAGYLYAVTDWFAGFLSRSNGSSWDVVAGPFSNPATDAVLRDDFMGGAGSGNTGMGELGWSNSGTGTVSSQAGEASHPGIMRSATAASTGSTNQPRLNASAGFLASELFDTVWLVRLNTNDSDTTVRVGVGNVTVGQPSNGVYVEKLATDTAWSGVTRATASQTRTVTLVSCDTGWVAFRIRRIDPSTVGFTTATTIAGLLTATEVTATATLPTGVVFPFIGTTTAANTIKSLDADLYLSRLGGLSR